MFAYFVVIPVLIAVFLFIFSSNSTARVLAITFQTLFTAFSFYLFMITRGEDYTSLVGGYADFLGVSLRVYNTSSVFILLTTLIFLVVSVYSFYETNSRTFWFLLFVLEGALVGLYLTRDLFNIFVLVEVSTIVVIILLMYERRRRKLLAGMLFLMINVVAMQFYLFGLGYLYMITGAFDMAYVAAAISATEKEALILPYALIMTALAFKCALIPLYSFVPKARLYPAAPSAVAAILSGVQIKTSIYLFMRFQEVFGYLSAHDFFLIIGIITGIAGVIMAIAQTDIKMILAYHTVSQVGLIIIGLSSGSEYSNLGGLYHVVSHGIFKSALFLTAGIIRLSYGTTDVYKIRGVMRRMPVVGLVCAAAILGITGAPFFIGSVSKYFIAYDVPLFVSLAVILISLGTIISFIKYAGMLFGRSDRQGFQPFVDPWRLAPCVVLGLLCLGGGVFGVPVINFLFVTDMSINWLGYAEKSGIFFLSVAAGLIIYRFAVKGNSKLNALANMELGFKGICASMGAFFGVLLIVVGLL